MKTSRTQKLTIGAVAGTVALVILVWALVLAFNGDSDSTKSAKDEETSTQPIAPDPDLKLGEKPKGSLDNHRKALLKKSERLLRDSAKYSEAYGSYDKTIKAVGQGDFSKLPKSYRSQFRLVDYFEKEKAVQGAAYLATLNLGKFVEDLAEKNDSSIKPTNDDRWKNVFVDLDAGVGFVPVANFVEGGSSFSLEFVYVDGKWIYSPYSFIDTVSAVNAATRAASEDGAN